VTGLLGPNGKPISSKTLDNKKASPPLLGERYGQWAGENVPLFNLPGGGAIAFNTSTLTLSDFRQMRGHYQINSSLSVLTFMMHQMEWHIEVDDPTGRTTEAQRKKIAAHVEENLGEVWSRLVRAMSQALWAGYSPSALEWENDLNGRAIRLNKVKDLYPEECRVHWKKIESSIPSDSPGGGARKVYHNVYDGIDQYGAPRIPVDNSYWYPLLMENGNYYGRRLLESAFQPWFFSTLLHLFANRYYERFGEPVPVGRAPYEDEIEVGGKSVKGNQLMAMILQNLRNRSTVVLPNDKSQFGDETTLDFDYQIEYLESQMRGADFERYMTRLDEEMSLAMFTPILMMRTADVGSYNLGQQHTQTYQWMLNAFSGDWKFYIDKYICGPMVNWNFGINAPRAKIKFMKMGKVQSELLQSIITSMMTTGAGGKQFRPDVREIGELAGLTFEEIEIVKPETLDAPPQQDPAEPDPNKDEPQTDQVKRFISDRVRQQIAKCYRVDKWAPPKLGHAKQLQNALQADGYGENVENRVRDFYDDLDGKIENFLSDHFDDLGSTDAFMRVFDRMMDNALTSIKR
jgi:hypothetical protein